MRCLPRETLKSRMMDHGSERRKVGADGGVFHCYIAAYMYPKDGVRTSDRSPSPVKLEKIPHLSLPSTRL